MSKSQFACALVHEQCEMWVYYYTSNGGKYHGLYIIWVYITPSHKFCCSLSNAKKSFYRAFTCVFGKVGRVASENVIVELLEMKCLPCLCYGLEACPLIQSQLRSLEFAVNSAFRKIFSTKSYEVVSNCVKYFNCSVSNSITERRTFS